MAVGGRAEGESRSKDASEGEREEGGGAASSGQPIGGEPNGRQHNRKHADRNQGSVGRDQLSRSVGAHFVQRTTLRPLRQLQFPAQGRLYQSKGQTFARPPILWAILGGGCQEELRQAEADESRPGEALQGTKGSSVSDRADRR